MVQLHSILLFCILVSGCGIFDSEGTSKKKVDLPFHWQPERSFPEHANSIWIDKKDNLYVGGDEGWYFSEDYGKSFTKHAVPDSVLSFNIKKFGNTYYGVGHVISDFHVIGDDTTYGFFWGATNNFYTSTDGNNWEKVTGPFPMLDFVLHGGNVYFGKEQGVVTHNLDTGEEFEVKFYDSDKYSVRIYEVEANNNGDVFAGTMGGIFRSQDFGETWENVTDEIPDGKVRVNRIVVNGEEMYGVGSAILYSSDSGESWQVMDYQMENYEGELENLLVYDFDLTKYGYKYSINYLGFFMYDEAKSEYFKFYGPEKLSFRPPYNYLRYSEVHAFNGNVMITSSSNVFYQIGIRNTDSDYWSN